MAGETQEAVDARCIITGPENCAQRLPKMFWMRWPDKGIALQMVITDFQIVTLKCGHEV